MDICLDRDKALRLCEGMGRDLADHLAVLKPDLFVLLSKYPAPAVLIQDVAFVVAGGLFLSLAAPACLEAWGDSRPSVALSGPTDLYDSLHLEEAGGLTFVTFGTREGPRLAFPDILSRLRQLPVEADLVDQVFRQRLVGLMGDSGYILEHVFKGCGSLGQLKEEFSHVPDLDSLIMLMIKCSYLVLEGDSLLVVATFLGEGEIELLNSSTGLLLPELFAWHQHNLPLIRSSTRSWGQDFATVYGCLWPLLAGYCCSHLSKVGFFSNPAQDQGGYRPAVISTPLLRDMVTNATQRADMILKASR